MHIIVSFLPSLYSLSFSELKKKHSQKILNLTAVSEDGSIGESSLVGGQNDVVFGGDSHQEVHTSHLAENTQL